MCYQHVSFINEVVGGVRKQMHLLLDCCAARDSVAAAMMACVASLEVQKVSWQLGQLLVPQCCRDLGAAVLGLD